MSRLTGPLLSFGARGQIAKTQVYSSWKGIQYARRYVIPAQPPSSDRDKTQNAFRWLQGVYQVSPQAFRAPWETAASGRPLTGRNLWTKRNLPLLREETDNDLMIFSPGAKGGLPATFVITSPSTDIVATPVVPDPLPAGWTIVGAVALAIKAQDPQSDTDYEMFVSDAATGPAWVATITAPGAGDYQVGAFFVYQRSTSVTDLAYGPSAAQQNTV